MSENHSQYTPKVFAENRKKLAALFPSAYRNGLLDLDALQAQLGNVCVSSDERYELRWTGKAAAKRLAGQSPAGRTLRYVPGDSHFSDDTHNLFIEGDNLEVLKLLRQCYGGMVKVIYIDPPYNTGADVIYKDRYHQGKWESDTAEGDIVDGERMIRNQRSSNRFHADWLNMIYPRLLVAKELLRDDGVIFISIDDGELDNLLKLCKDKDLFTEENYVALFPWRKRTAKSDVPFGVSQDYEWIVCFAKSGAFLAGLEGGTRRYYETEDLPGRPWRIHDLTKQTSASERPNSNFTLVNPKTGEEYPANPNRTWAITRETLPRYLAENRIVFPGDYDFLGITRPAFRYFQEDDRQKAGERFGLIPASTKLPEEIGMTQDGTKEITDLFGGCRVFPFPKPVALVKHLVKMATATSPDRGDIVLDFFCGSGTTAHAVMALNAEDGGNRRFVMVQLPEPVDSGSEAAQQGYDDICALAKERIRLAGERVLARCPKDGPLPDIGFRVLRAGETTLRRRAEPGNNAWPDPAQATDSGTGGAEASPFRDERAELISMEETSQSPGDREDFVPGATDQDVVYELMLRLAATPLDTPPESLPQVGGRTYRVPGPVVVCLEEKLTREVLEQLAGLRPLPVLFLLRDSAFGDDSDLKDYTARLLDALIARENGGRRTYTVDFL